MGHPQYCRAVGAGYRWQVAGLALRRAHCEPCKSGCLDPVRIEAGNRGRCDARAGQGRLQSPHEVVVVHAATANKDFVCIRGRSSYRLGDAIGR